MKKFGFAAAIACVVSAGAYGFAASFGTAAGGLGANGKVVAACGTGMRFSYEAAFDPSISGYDVDAIDLLNIPAGCLNKTVSVTFFASDDTADGSAVSASLPASGTSERIPVAPGSDAIDAGRISGVSVIVF